MSTLHEESSLVSMNAFVEFQEKAADQASVPSRAPSPNEGASIDDAEAIKEGCNKADWLRSRNIDTAGRVVLRKVSHMRYQHPDLQQITTFMKDFGMKVVKKTQTQRWFGGYGPDHYVYYAQQGPKRFLGGTFEVESYQELEKIVQIPSVRVIDGGIQEMTDAPGGGSILSIIDPEGFPVNFIYGQTEKTAITKHPPRLLYNDESTKARRRQFQRFDPGPAEVYKLGHFGLCVNHFQKQLEFYTHHFNIVPSDILYVPEEDKTNGTMGRREVAMFAHIDRGHELVDHHTLFLTTLAPGMTPHVHHCSFEVHDFDTQALGHQWLSDKGYKSVWGLGRHILGSQIFDYWWDTTGFMVEHYADGDLVTIDTPLAFGPAGHEGLAVWGPEVPVSFLE